MRKISIKAIAACTMALAMASCQVNDEQLGQDANYTQDDFAPITFSSNITTRATEANFEVGDMISVAAYYSDNSIYRQNVEYTYTNDALFESSSPIKYEDNIQYLSFTAVYPYTEVSEDGDLSFEVKSDQSEDTNYTLSDLMNSSASPTQSTTPSLTFDHLLANIVVNIYSEDVLLDGAVATLKAKRGVNCNILSGTTEATGDVETIKMASNGTNSYKAIIAPQTFNDGIFICVEVDSMKYYITYEGGKTFEPALQYTYNLEIYDGTLRFTTVINSWKEGNIDEDGTYEESGEGESEQVQPEEDDEEDVEEATKEIDDDSVTLLDRSTWTLTASATEEYEGALEYAIDGEFGTYWHSPWSDGSAATDGSSITVNMGSVNSLYCLVMLPRSASQYNTGGIYTSIDGNSWTFAREYACAAEYNWNYFYFDEKLIEAQYFMFTCENNYGMVDEIYAYTANYK